MTAKPEWEKFKVGELSTTRWVNPDCQQLTTVSHVAHIETAKRIFKDGKINSGLIFDKSKLNTERILVAWLSPNHWSDGFRYGNVRFNYDWKTLIANKRYYWVESLAYGVKACRILVTDEDRSDILEEYDPTRRDGPWWFDEINDNHYWNGNYCLEIMIERDVDIDDCLTIDFVNHHLQFCNILPLHCEDCGRSNLNAGKRLISYILSNSYNFPRKKFLGTINAEKCIKDDVVYIVRLIMESLPDYIDQYSGDITSDSDVALPLAKSILSYYSDEDKKNCEKLLSLFDSADEFIKTLEKLCVKRFRVKHLYEEDYLS